MAYAPFLSIKQLHEKITCLYLGKVVILQTETESLCKLKRE